MISKKHRAPKQLIRKILSTGEEFRSSLFIVRKLKNNEQFPRFRAIVSKKIYPKAVDRNYLRRQIYETIQVLSQNSSDNNDYIFIPKKKIINANYQELAQDLQSLIK